MNAPHLRKQGTATQLIVHDRPFLIIGGELHNSSSSSLSYMEPIWGRMRELNFNTVLAPVSWELIEPKEGEFDFALVDGLIADARANGMKLVFLWFGSWKNGMSSYVPVWVKRDVRRFPRVRLADGSITEILSTLTPANWQADAAAFSALMRHIREVDSREQTVIMVQVENEVGVLRDSRDRCEAANIAFNAAVPAELVAYIEKNRAHLVPELQNRWRAHGYRTNGTWQEVFGAGPFTDEIFMAWHYARYVNEVTAAGKKAYHIPMYVNAWLTAPNQSAGQYPSGGPLPPVMDIWLAAAPAIDMLSPDIYSSEFADWCGRYTQRSNPLFIPEMRSNEDGARNVYHAIGQHDAIGVSPFAVDGIENPAQSPLARSYAILRQLEQQILSHQGKNEMVGFILDKDHPTASRQLGDYLLEISLDAIFGYKAETGCGLIIATGSDTFVGAGCGFGVSFRALAGPHGVGIAAVDEGIYVDGRWVAGRRLNGDENDQGNKWRFPIQQHAIQHCALYRID